MPYNIVNFVHTLLEPYIKAGDRAVDLTCGNGNDTLFLCKGVGSLGVVYAFDVQEGAINNTKALLSLNDCNNYRLILDSHINLDKYDMGQIKCAMLNLGYLPKGDKNITTKAESTVLAVKMVLNLLCIGGVVSIVSYYGHEGGLCELNAVSDYLKMLDYRYFVVKRIEFYNGTNNPPIIFLVEKTK